MLITIDSIAQQLKGKFGGSPFDLSDMCLIEPGVNASVIEAAEKQLEVTFPDEMLRLLKKYDFSRLSLANLIFDYGDDLESLVELNLGQPVPWWGTGKRPSHLLLVAQTDGHAIFLSINDGRIIATDKGAPRPKQEITVAENFEELIKIAGMVALGESQTGRVEAVASLALGSFWKKITAGTA